MNVFGEENVVFCFCGFLCGLTVLY